MRLGSFVLDFSRLNFDLNHFQYFYSKCYHEVHVYWKFCFFESDETRCVLLCKLIIKI